MRRVEECQEKAEGDEPVSPVMVGRLANDVQRLVDALLDSQEKTSNLRKKWGSAIYRQSEAMKIAIGKKRRNRCGLGPKELFLLKHLIENYPVMPVAECGNRALGRNDMTYSGTTDRLHRAGWRIETRKFRVLVQHYQSALPAIPIPTSWKDAVAEEGDYEAPPPAIMQGEGDDSEEGG